VPRDAEDLKGRNMLKADFISQAEQHKYYGNDINERRKYVGHHSLNFSKSDMEGMTSKKIEQITKDYIKDAGIDQTQYIAVAHKDTELYHVHIIFNRATDKQTLYNDWREYNKTAERAVALNLKYGFEQVNKQAEMSNSPEVLAIRSGHEDIQKLKADELINRAKNLHHLSKICEAEKRSFKEHGDIIKIEDKEYRKTDLQAVFYDNRGEPLRKTYTNLYIAV
jgi:Relaxase/Mobilisation nuclease domain